MLYFIRKYLLCFNHVDHIVQVITSLKEKEKSLNIKDVSWFYRHNTFTTWNLCVKFHHDLMISSVFTF